MTPAEHDRAPGARAPRETPGPSGIRRILVALDASADSVAALEAAVALAARLEADLQGLFIEDVDVMHAAGLPYAREIRVFQSVPRLIDVGELEAQILARARAIERELGRAAQRAEVRWSFRRVRGRVEPELLAATGAADLVVVGRAGHSPLARRKLGSATRAVVREAERPVLLLGRRVRLREPAFAVYDGSAGSRRALALASEIAGGGDEALHVIVAAPTGARADELAGEARALLADHAGDVVVHRVLRPRGHALARAACEAGAGVLVAASEGAPFRHEALPGTLDEVGCPILLVR